MGDEPGNNFRLSELHAALAASQLERLDRLIAERQKLAETYRRTLDEVPGIAPHPDAAGDTRTSRFAFAVRLGDEYDAGHRDAIREGMADAGIETGHYFPSVDTLPPFRDGRRSRIAGSLNEAHALSDRVIALPFFSGMEGAQVDRVVATLADQLARQVLG